jgi:hypothetical protein
VICHRCCKKVVKGDPETTIALVNDTPTLYHKICLASDHIDSLVEENKYLNWCLSFMIGRCNEALEDEIPCEGASEELWLEHLKNTYENRKNK